MVKQQYTEKCLHLVTQDRGMSVQNASCPPHQGVRLCVPSQVGQCDDHIGDVLLRHRLQVVHQHTDRPARLQAHSKPLSNTSNHAAPHIGMYAYTHIVQVRTRIHIYTYSMVIAQPCVGT